MRSLQKKCKIIKNLTKKRCTILKGVSDIRNNLATRSHNFVQRNIKFEKIFFPILRINKKGTFIEKIF